MSQTPCELIEEVSLDLTYLLGSSGEAGGIWQSAFKGLGTDAISLRPYQSGDSHRDIHRPSYALFKRGERREVMVKEFIDEVNLVVWLFMDLSDFLVCSGDLPSPYTKPSRDTASIFSAIVMAAAESWGVSVGLGGRRLETMYPASGREYFESILSRIQELPVQEISEVLIQDRLVQQEATLRGAKNSLTFFISGFTHNVEEYARMFRNVRVTNRVDVVPVYLDPSWVWDTVGGTFEMACEDASGKLSRIVTNAHGRSRIVEAAKRHHIKVGNIFARANLPWIHLTEPNARQIEERMTNCFVEKRQSL